MGTYFDLTVSMYLRADLTDGQLAGLRWMIGQGPRPDDLEELPGYAQVSQVVGGLHPRTLIDDTWLVVPGGEHVSLVEGALTSHERFWSLSLHVLHDDDTYYHEVIPGLCWLATLARGDGVYAWASDRDHGLFPSWVFVAGGGHAYLMNGSALEPVDEEATPAPVAVLEALGRFVTPRQAGRA